MSVLLLTSLGPLTLDLTLSSPNFTSSFLHLCKLRYYDQTLFFNIIKNRFTQTGDPSGSGNGGSSVYGVLSGQSTHRFLKDEFVKVHEEVLKEKGIVFSTSIVNSIGQIVPDTSGSQFCINLCGGEGRGLHEYGLGEVNVFGRIVEDPDNVLDKLNECYTDSSGRPYADVRIISTTVLHDPYSSTPLTTSSSTEDYDSLFSKKHEEILKKNGGSYNDTPVFERPEEEELEIRINVNEEIEEKEGVSDEQKMEDLEVSKAKSRAVVLEMLGDLKSADDKPPENVLFICKLNSITQDDDLELIFSRFDQSCSAEIMRDPETGDSLNYGFVSFKTKVMAQEAFFKMNNAMVDDRRIRVDFSQSVKGLWKSRRNPGGGGRGGGGRGGGPLRLGGFKPKPNPTNSAPVFTPPPGSYAAKERERKRARSESESSSSSSSSEEKKKKKKKSKKEKKKSKKSKKEKKEKKEKKRKE
ncbi:hypothetical protein TL16_g05035 [Triparma laevis f. inornata]|uniref:Peptidyl-prolyl cis-trans isomerase n=1 Tax=Triparma laevis f. inornata TaxID=1714386 RepID=A0A9W7AAX2_9STRA|nr:hypothetical protein TL16_g05035 [Triparma laevis f. inornata]